MSERAQAFVDTGVTYLEKGDHRAALELFDLALAEDGGCSDALFGRGFCLLHLGKTKQGWVEVRRAAKLGSEAARELLRREGVASSPGWGRYVWAGFLCFVVLAIWNVMGVALFKWKYGGGAFGHFASYMLVYGVWKLVLRTGSEYSNCKLDGVRGWLGFFCVQVILGGLLIIFRAISKYDNIYFIFDFPYGIWMVLTGVLLVKKTKNCVVNAKIYLVSSAAVFVLAGVSGEYVLVDDDIMKILQSVAWLVYFFVSKRVQVTYSRG